jgi:2-polyprenyl-6-methoxyphenol hydroxylase-like FAD-dependent oxidoreductase
MITIIGAGVPGPLLAYMLQKGGADCTLPEADPSLETRHQSGMLNLNEGTGQLALHAAGLYQTALDHVLPGGDALRLPLAPCRSASKNYGHTWTGRLLHIA